MAKQIAQIFGYQSHQMISSDKHGGPVNSTFQYAPRHKCQGTFFSDCQSHTFT